jgi:hypothetical protein
MLERDFGTSRNGSNAFKPESVPNKRRSIAAAAVSRNIDLPKSAAALSGNSVVNLFCCNVRPFRIGLCLLPANRYILVRCFTLRQVAYLEVKGMLKTSVGDKHSSLLRLILYNEKSSEIMFAAQSGKKVDRSSKMTDLYSELFRPTSCR